MTSQLDEPSIADAAIDFGTVDDTVIDVATAGGDGGAGRDQPVAPDRRRRRGRWVVPACVVAAAVAVAGVAALRDSGSHPSPRPSSVEAGPSSYELVQRSIEEALAEQQVARPSSYELVQRSIEEALAERQQD
jgi:hypothetical protein